MKTFYLLLISLMIVSCSKDKMSDDQNLIGGYKRNFVQFFVQSPAGDDLLSKDYTIDVIYEFKKGKPVVYYDPFMSASKGYNIFTYDKTKKGVTLYLNDALKGNESLTYVRFGNADKLDCFKAEYASNSYLPIVKKIWLNGNLFWTEEEDYDNYTIPCIVK